MPGSRGVRHWRDTLAASLTTAEELAQSLPIDADAVRAVIRRYPMRINPYFLSVIKAGGAPLWRQAVPDAAELDPDELLAPDPLKEEPQSPVPHLIHRYPDRVVFMISSRCAVYCRHCMRKRRLGSGERVADGDISRGIAYIRENPGIREVILSGGDPLLVSDERLEKICRLLKKIAHVEVLRIHSRAPCTLPSRISSDLALLLASFQPLYLNIQFNHPAELTHEAVAACARLADAGIPLGSQSVLLQGVNDNAQVMASLMRELLKNRIRPYYLHHADPVEGTRHFRTSIDRGLSIMRHLRGRISGMGVPDYMIDLPGGGGKIPLLPEYVAGVEKDRLIVRNYKGEKYVYPAYLQD
ncbi:MAG TPA: KamA family radical SAM protein [Desulfosalsimonadaceae bacterium]|nr:KamA family radical SAM protein [Desulfosalsimonadaceae bacterium]